jgi:predicted MFS family arabinose efflux permease
MATTASISTYSRVLGLPGALAFSVSGLVARMPMSMVSLGIVLTVSAAFLVANALFATHQARSIDRLGQRRVLPVAAAAFSGGLVALMLLVELGGPAPWPHVAAAVAGAALPQIGSSVRSRWAHLVEDKSDLHTAYSFESVVDEVVFIVGPALVTVFATVIHPLAGLICAVVATLVGTAAFVGQKRTEPPATGAGRRTEQAPMPWRVLLPLMACAAMLGAMLGGAEVATIAFADQRGATAMSGLMLAIWALGSLVSGVLTGAVRSEASNPTRFRWSMVALTVLVLPLPFMNGFWALAGCLFVSGFAISPTLIAGFAWIEEVVPARRLTEGMTVFTTALGIGLAPGAALAGVAVDASGPSAAYWVVIGAGLVGSVVAVCTARHGRPDAVGLPPS